MRGRATRSATGSGVTVLSIGDFRLLVALIGSWAGIALVSVLAVLGPFERKA